MSSVSKETLANIKRQLNSKIYFYSSRNDKYGFLSNFYPSEILIDGYKYYHVEGYYQASKFIGCDEDISMSIRNEINPLVCKVIAQDFAMLEDRAIEWELGLRNNVMRRAVLTKFITNSTLGGLLLDTGDKILIENSPSDYYWGCGKDETGENMLGKILMEVRDTLKSITNRY